LRLSGPKTGGGSTYNTPFVNSGFRIGGREVVVFGGNGWGWNNWFNNGWCGRWDWGWDNCWSGCRTFFSGIEVQSEILVSRAALELGVPARYVTINNNGQQGATAKEDSNTGTNGGDKLPLHLIPIVFRVLCYGAGAVVIWYAFKKWRADRKAKKEGDAAEQAKTKARNDFIDELLRRGHGSTE
jgi:hypothetical protein